MKEVRFVEQLLGLPGTGSHFGKKDGVRTRNRSNPYFQKVTKPLNLDCSRVLGIQAQRCSSPVADPMVSQ